MLEIERKFLVNAEKLPSLESLPSDYIRQYYLETMKVDIRLRNSNGSWKMTFKSIATLVRDEVEFAIADHSAEELVGKFAVTNAILKRRYRLIFEGREWTIDAFEGANSGLIMAEVEFNSVRDELVVPPWAGREVTNDHRYYNRELALFDLETRSNSSQT